MSKFFQRVLVLGAFVLLPWAMSAQQLPNPSFEDWSGEKFDGEIQPKSWNASNVEQLSFQFNFAHREAGHTGNYCMMVQDQDVGAAGITETSPGYFSLGKPWVYLESITKISQATAGTAGSISWKYRPDSMSVWIKRTGNNTDKEDFYLLYYSWTGTAQGDKYKGKNGNCTSVTKTDEESDVRQALDANECGTYQKATQVAEGMWRQKKTYSNWTKITVPILYFNDNKPSKMNIIFSASNYPNFRANSGLYAGNSLYVDDVELIYSSRIQKLYIGDKDREWKGFDPNTEEVQKYSLGESATSIPAIFARRGAGSITNARGTTVTFPGRYLEEGADKEMQIEYGDLNDKPTIITVKSEDGKSQTVYKIQFQRAPSTNATLAEVFVNGNQMTDFRPAQTNYTVELPYGTKDAPVLTYTQAEDAQTVVVNQATSPTGTATITVTAADKTTKKTYTFNFKIAQLSDVTLKDIKVNGKSIPGFSPAQAVYKVSLPTSTTAAPTIEAVSAYEEGAQTITITTPTIEQIKTGNAQAQIRVSAPGATSEKVYKLNFKIEESSYAYLADLQIVGDQIVKVNPSLLDDPTKIAFDLELTNYYVTLQMGSLYLPKILYTPGDEFQTIKVDTSKVVNGNGTARIEVTAGNKLDQMIYKVVFTAPKSENTALAGIQIGGQPLEGFDPNETNYSVNLPVGTTELPIITWTKGDEFQTVTPVYRGINGTTSITVTAGNGDTRTYNITFSVSTYTDNRLASLSVSGATLQNKTGETVAFDPEVKEYWCKLGMGTDTVPQVNVALRSAEYQDTTVTRPTKVPGNYKITVTPVNGASRTYTIHFTVEVSYNTALKMIYLDGDSLEGFDPETLDYVDTIKTGTDFPTVTWDKAEATQNVESILNKRTQRIIVSQSGASRTYTIRFVFPASNNTQVNNIELQYPDKEPEKLQGFKKDSFDYVHPLQAETCPKIIVTPAAGQQITITAPYADGTATIVVKSEDGSEESIYTIEFTKTIDASMQLDMIYINGAQVPGYSKEQPHYTANYSNGLPTISWLPGDANAEVLWKNTDKETIAYVVVSEPGNPSNKAVYDIVFTQVVSGNNTLKAIYADDVLIDGFAKDKYTYSYPLAAGKDYPTLTYEVEENEQVVFFGQLEEGKWRITVQAENMDTVSYTVQYMLSKHNDDQLEDLEVAGYPFSFAPETFTYGPFNIDEGVELPQVTPTPKAGKNQKVLVLNATDDEQHVLVMAENGTDSARYVIKYTRVKSSISALKKIYIDGKELLEFHPDTLQYTIQLPVGTEVVPNVFPIGELDNQVITTTFGKPDEATTILVQAQDGVSSTIYTINFPVAVSANTKLQSLTINGDNYSVDNTEYVFDMPFDSREPYEVEFEKGDDYQLIEYIKAPITGVTKIIVTAQNGDKRTYSISYNIAQPTEENIVTRIDYSYTDAEGTKTDKIENPKKGDNIVNLPFGCTEFAIDSVYKKYPEQTIMLFNGGIRRGAKIIAVANRQGVNDATYTVTPVMPEMKTEGKLKSLTFKGKTVPNFRPDVYNYIVKVTSQPTDGDFIGTAYDDKVVTKSALDNKKKQITLTVTGGETYSVCWYYTNYDKLLDFSSDWVTVSKGIGYKPSSLWKVPGDCVKEYTWKISLIVNLTYTTGKEVTPGGTNGVMLSTLRGAPMNTSVPGMMTLGEMSLKLGSSGNSSSSVTKSAAVGTEFKNTPEAFEFLVKPLSTSNITNWKMWLTMSDGTNYKESNYTGDFNNLNKWATVNVPISYAGVGTVSKFNVMLSSCDQENANSFNGNTIYESSVMYDNIHFVYNSQLTAATVNGKATTKSGNTFTYSVPANATILSMPSLKFTGAVHDQTQTIEWLNNGEWVDGKLTARVINYGENAQDSTHYYVVLQRAAVEDLSYDAKFGSYKTTVKDDTTFVHLPFAMQKMPELKITPNDINQRFAITKEGDAVTVIVTNEKNVSDTMVYVFRQNLSKDATVTNIVAYNKKGTALSYNELFDPTTTYDYTINELTYKYEVTAGDDGNLNQTIDLQYTATGATVKVTAEDGKTTNTYTITFNKPTVVTNGKITKFIEDDEDWTNLGDEKYAAEAEKPASPVLFIRAFASDAVVFLQTKDSMAWQVSGDESHTYVLKYPTALSKNTLLAQLLVEGTPKSDFEPTNNTVPVTIYGDTTQTVEAIGAEEAQTITTTMEATTGGAKYTINVTAESGDTTRTYVVLMTRQLDERATLQGIYLDNTLLTGFDPEKTDYTVTLPAPKGAKMAHAKMPNITYVAAHKGQVIELTPGEMNGEATTISVTNERGNLTKTYKISVVEEKSSCTDLTGIFVNDNPLDGFEPGRHFYSVSLPKDQISINYTCDDRFFQRVDTIIDTVQVSREYQYTLRVTAENGETSSYQVEIYVENQLNDADLANIYLNDAELGDVDFLNYRRWLNTGDVKAFDPGMNEYEIAVPKDTIPNVNASLKMDGQSVVANVTSDVTETKVVMTVTAADGVTKKDYTVHLWYRLPTDANLTEIRVKNIPVDNFSPTENIYLFDKLSMDEDLPTPQEISFVKSDELATASVEVDGEKSRAVITVKAQDVSVINRYYITFQRTPSNADTLDVINERFTDGSEKLLEGFRPTKDIYYRELAVGTQHFPEINYGDERYEGDGLWPSIKVVTDTIDSINMTRFYQTLVTAQSGRTRTYTINYRILKSNVTTLQTIRVDTTDLGAFRAIEGFEPDKVEYYVELSASRALAYQDGKLPRIEVALGDEYQDTLINSVRDSLTGKSLGYRHMITVTAQDGSSRIYTVHYPVQLSSDATLKTILYDGNKVVPNFDSERENYKIEIEVGAAIPIITPVKNDETQIYEINVSNDTVTVDVWAEDNTHKAYVIIFERVKSNVTTLSNIVLTDKISGKQLSYDLFEFKKTDFDYTIVLPYDSLDRDSVPEISPVKADSLQEFSISKKALTNAVEAIVRVIAPNGVDEAEYKLIFQFTRNNNADLKDIKLNKVSVKDFKPNTLDYNYYYPYGSDSTDFVSNDNVLDVVKIVKSDPKAKDTIYVDTDASIVITITAQDGKSQNTYSIHQFIGKDTVNTLAMLYLDGDSLKGFDPNQTFYTYMLKNGASATPVVYGETTSDLAEVDATKSDPKVGVVNDTLNIYCTAQDGSERIYRILFLESTVNDGLTASERDVFVRRVAGAYQLFVATIRKDVTFILYDQNGHMLYNHMVPDAEPNAINVTEDVFGNDILLGVDVDPNSGLLVDIDPGQVYFYSFVKRGKKIIKTGKIMAL